MPEPIRDAYSGALVFIPTQQEQLYLESKKALDRELEEVRELKLKLQELLDRTS